ncbi:hypothetical protein QUA43_12995 [Microcoleus sp. N9_B4]|uniref:hypothetical protein n=1 Tax=Microcoleus sp. N9_B4 TaxID=3055386 RepID=UPI002FCFA629
MNCDYQPSFIAMVDRIVQSVVWSCMNRNSNRKINQDERLSINSGLSSSLRKKYSITIIILIILSVLSISLKSDKVNSNIWSLSVELKVTSVTLVLLFLFWIPILLPWILSQVPQVQGSLNWLREQGIEEIETNLLRIKLKYGVQEASEKYEEKISDIGAINLTSQETQQQLEGRYREAIALVDAASDIDSTEALKRIDQLAGYYDRVRDEMPYGHNRTKLMHEISSTMWTLIPKVINFPVHERLNSQKGGERLSAYKHVEWNTSTDYINLLVSRAVGIMEMPYTQYAALLALRRVVTNNQFSPSKSAEIIDILNWSANLDYMKPDRRKLMIEIASLLKTKA